MTKHNASTASADPGDLGRRVARRRAQLGLTREQVAKQARIAVGYLDYLESQPAELTSDTLARLASALQTTPAELLGAGIDRPPGRGRPTLRDHAITEQLSPDVCRRLIAGGGVGRVALETDQGPVVLPVNFAVDHDTIVFRTEPHTVLARNGPGTEVAFEVDRLDDPNREGWSVLLVGRVERIDDPNQVRALKKSGSPEPWAAGTRDLYLRLRPHRITGRRIHAGRM